MKSLDGMVHYGSKSDYLKKTSVASKGLASKGVSSESAKGHIKGIQEKVSQEATRVELSEKIKEMASNNSLSENKKEISKASTKILEGAKEVAKKTLSSPSFALSKILGTAEQAALSRPSQASQTSQVNQVNQASDEQLNGPAIFFIRGFELFGFNDGGGMKEMSENIPDAKYYSWQDEDKIIDEIKKKSKGQPIVLVGHGMGGDAGVSISQKLNSAAHGFAKVHLLITLDSVGLDNDIIPQNVKKNINFITEGNGLLSDGPNIARRSDLTEVENFLQKEGHDELVESSEIQFKIFENINDLLFGQEALKEKPEEHLPKDLKTIS